MEQKHPEGYWVKQLMAKKQVEDLAKTLLAKNRGFVSIKNLKLTNNEIKFFCNFKQLRGTTCEYPSRTAEITIKDFEFNGFTHSKKNFYNFMIEQFGDEYAEELIEYLDKLIPTLTQNTTQTESLITFKAKLEKKLVENKNQSSNHQEENETAENEISL